MGCDRCFDVVVHVGFLRVVDEVVEPADVFSLLSGLRSAAGAADEHCPVVACAGAVDLAALLPAAEEIAVRSDVFGYLAGLHCPVRAGDVHALVLPSVVAACAVHPGVAVHGVLFVALAIVVLEKVAPGIELHLAQGLLLVHSTNVEKLASNLMAEGLLESLP